MMRAQPSRYRAAPCKRSVATPPQRHFHARLRPWAKHGELINWIKETAQLCRPASIHVCEGTEAENRDLLSGMVASGTLIKLNEQLRPNSYLARSDPSDVARVEDRTFICSRSEGDAGPTNNWRDPEIMRRTMTDTFRGSMEGRTMYVVPFSMGPLGSPLSQIGIQLTDSPYVVANMRTMTRMGIRALDALGEDGPFVRCVHSIGAPLAPGAKDIPWPCDPNKKYIVHFPEDRTIMSYGSGYGGNALLGKKCFALRIASVMGREEGWLAEHMLILSVTNPKGKKRYFAAAFPSACGKTNLAMLTPKLPGWKVSCVGDDIAWMRFGPDGQLYAINPEAGFFGVAPGTSMQSNPNAMLSVSKNTIFTNVALTPENDVWWEGMTSNLPRKVKNWRGADCSPEAGEEAAHPNARFTVAASQCPVIDSDWENPNGVPIDGIIFGGRRSSIVPLVYEALNWEHGTFIGSVVNSETTAAAFGARGVLRPDPFAMKPFCGYNMGDYFQHWLNIGASTPFPKKVPRIFHVNWFKKSPSGRFLWPGFGDNARVLKWMFERLDGTARAVHTPVGLMPDPASIDLSGLQNINTDAMQELLRVDTAEWQTEVAAYREFHKQLGSRLPARMTTQLDALKYRLAEASRNQHTESAAARWLRT